VCSTADKVSLCSGVDPHSNRRRTQSEADARCALELLGGHNLTDAEWVAARAKVMDFMGILRVWDQTTNLCHRGNVGGPCKREP
jgi:hypothetical protein